MNIATNLNDSRPRPTPARLRLRHAPAWLRTRVLAHIGQRWRRYRSVEYIPHLLESRFGVHLQVWGSLLNGEVFRNERWNANGGDYESHVQLAKSLDLSLQVVAPTGVVVFEFRRHTRAPPPI